MGGAGSIDTVTIAYDGSQTARSYPCVWLPDEVIEKIAEAVVRKLNGTVDPRYCDRNICKTNELNGVGCDECVIAQNHNLEDDDSPCLNCEVEE